eukprot:4364905-Ditylum_brightwellii.AAC.1
MNAAKEKSSMAVKHRSKCKVYKKEIKAKHLQRRDCLQGLCKARKEQECIPGAAQHGQESMGKPQQGPSVSMQILHQQRGHLQGLCRAGRKQEDIPRAV